MDLDSILSLFIDNPVTAGIVSVVVVALVTVGLKIAQATKNTVDDSIFGLLADLLRLRRPAPPPAEPTSGGPIMRERTDGEESGPERLDR